MADDAKILVGTTKGAFVLRGPDRSAWTVHGPFCGGWPINHVIGDPGTGTIWAAGGNAFFGAGVWRSADAGETWELSQLTRGQIDDFIADEPELAEAFGIMPCASAPFTGEFETLWSLGHANGTVYAGAKPAALFASHDGGANWEKVEGLTNHPSAEGWTPGAAGLTLHTIVPHPVDPDRIWVGISAAGVFGTRDGGKTWERMNRRDPAKGQLALDHPASGNTEEIGHCVHNMVRAPGARDILYQENHVGTFRSDDGGKSWISITDGLPSTFGFPIAVHPRDADTAWVFPLNGDSRGRFPPDAIAAVWRTRDGGKTWSDQRNGLPQGACYFTVLRQAMSTDRDDPAGVYFGTNSGSVFASTDEGDSWTEIARHLPTVLSVDVLQA